MVASIKTLCSRIRGWFTRARVDQDFDQELSSHLEMLTSENVKQGMSPDKAKRAAQMRLGGVTQLKETNRELRGLPMLETFLQDVRYALRMLRKNPGFTSIVILTLALGIGANTAIFSVVYAVLLKPLPYANAGQLVNVFETRLQDGIQKSGWSYESFKELREQNTVFSEVAGFAQHQLTLTGSGEPSVVTTSVVTPEFFTVFGAKPLAGRTFSPEDGNRGAAPVVILNENLWRDVFGADPKILGSSIQLDKKSFTVIGIMPAAFRFPRLTVSEQLWIPLAQDPLFGSWMDQRDRHWLPVTGRLKPDVSPARAQAELEAITARLAKEFPAENSGWSATMTPLQEDITGNVRPALLVLLAPRVWCCSSRARILPTCF